MIEAFDDIGLDYTLFAVTSVLAVGSLHVWIRRWQRGRGVLVLLWILAGAVLISGLLLIEAQEVSRRAVTIALLGALEAAAVTSCCLIARLRVEVRRRWRAQCKLVAYRRRLEEQVKQRSEELLELQRQSLQSEKLASIGQLASGVAHEINTPIQYVGDNLRAISDFLGDLVSLTDAYRELVEVVKASGTAGEVVGRIEQAEQERDLAFIREDAPRAVAQGLEGVQRVAHIVRAMKDFSHVNRSQIGLVDVNRALNTTLTIARNEYKYVADVETEFGELPEIESYGGELNQVFLNIVVNAAHAIGETGQRGVIRIRTLALGEQIEVAFSDTGPGIPPGIQGKIFDPFFTTKPVGKGTGQGLNIAHQIVHKHGGTIRFETELGKGTTFFIRLPVKLPQHAETDGSAACVNG